MLINPKDIPPAPFKTPDALSYLEIIDLEGKVYQIIKTPCYLVGETREMHFFDFVGKQFANHAEYYDYLITMAYIIIKYRARDKDFTLEDAERLPMVEIEKVEEFIKSINEAEQKKTVPVVAEL